VNILQCENTAAVKTRNTIIRGMVCLFSGERSNFSTEITASLHNWSHWTTVNKLTYNYSYWLTTVKWQYFQDCLI